MVLPMDQNGSDKVADLVVDLGKFKVNQVKGSTNFTAGDVPEKGKAHKQVKAVHGRFGQMANMQTLLSME